MEHVLEILNQIILNLSCYMWLSKLTPKSKNKNKMIFVGGTSSSIISIICYYRFYHAKYLNFFIFLIFTCLISAILEKSRISDIVFKVIFSSFIFVIIQFATSIPLSILFICIERIFKFTISNMIKYTCIIIVSSIINYLMYLTKTSLFHKLAHVILEKFYKQIILVTNLVILILCIVIRYSDYDKLEFHLCLLLCVFLLVFTLLPLINDYLEKSRLIDSLNEVIKDNHSYKESIPALEKQIKGYEAIVTVLKDATMKESFSSEVAEDMSLLNELSVKLKASSKEISLVKAYEETRQRKQYLQVHTFLSTGFTTIDFLLEEFQRETAEKEINFQIYVKNGEDLTKLTKKHAIHPEALKELIANLVRNAIRAVEKSNYDKPNILLQMGCDCNNIYSICISDTGTPFDIRILEHFGEEKNTTNGTGYGIPSMLATLSSCGASMIITEFSETPNPYTKSINLHFDKQNAIILKSYRYHELMERLGDYPDNPILLMPLES